MRRKLDSDLESAERPAVEILHILMTRTPTSSLLLKVPRIPSGVTSGMEPLTAIFPGAQHAMADNPQEPTMPPLVPSSVADRQPSYSSPESLTRNLTRPDICTYMAVRLC